MEFEWDSGKSASNQRKHGISFESAVNVFLDPNRQEWPDVRHDYGEARWITTGMVESWEVVICYTMRGKTIRLISARKAARREREDYWSR